MMLVQLLQKRASLPALFDFFFIYLCLWCILHYVDSWILIIATFTNFKTGMKTG